MARTLKWSCLAAVLLVLAVPAVGHANSKVFFQGTEFYAGSVDPAQRVDDLLSIGFQQGSLGPDFVISDPAGVLIHPGNPCIAFSPTLVHCPAANVTGIEVDLGNGDDQLDTAALRLFLSFRHYELGAGNDKWLGGPDGERIAFGPGRDIGVGGAGNDIGFGGGGNDTFDGDEGRDRFNGGKGGDRASKDTEVTKSVDLVIKGVIPKF